MRQSGTAGSYDARSQGGVTLSQGSLVVLTYLLELSLEKGALSEHEQIVRGQLVHDPRQVLHGENVVTSQMRRDPQRFRFRGIAFAIRWRKTLDESQGLFGGPKLRDVPQH